MNPNENFNDTGESTAAEIAAAEQRQAAEREAAERQAAEREAAEREAAEHQARVDAERQAELDELAAADRAARERIAREDEAELAAADRHLDDAINRRVPGGLVNVCTIGADYSPQAYVGALPPLPRLAVHEFAIAPGGLGMEHYINGTLRATVPTEGLQAYAEVWPDCATMARDLLAADH